MTNLKQERISWKGKIFSTSELIQHLDISRTSFYRKKREGLSSEEAIKWCLEHQRKEYTFQGELCTVEEVAKSFGIDRVSIYKYLNQGYQLETAIEYILKNKQMKYSPTQKKKVEIKTYFYQGKTRTIQEIAKQEKVSTSSLYQRLRDGLDLQQAIQEIKKNQQIRHLTDRLLTQKAAYFKIGEISLYQYCINQGYNYRSVVERIYKKKYTPEEAVEEYIEEGQDTRQKWKYSHGQVLLQHLLLKYQLNASYVLTLMKEHNWTVEEAIPKAVFSRKNEIYNAWEGKYLYELYQLFLVASQEERKSYLVEFQVTEQQKEILEENHQRICYIQRELLYYELAPQLKEASDDLRKEMIAYYGIIKEELAHINNGLYDDFILTENKKQGKIYRKKPMKNN